MKVLNTTSVGSCRSMSKQRLVQEARQELSKETLVEQLASTLLARDERLVSSLHIAL